MKKVIYNAICFYGDMVKAPNLVGGVEAYFKQSVISLVSAQRLNRDCDMMVLVSDEVPQKWKEIFEYYNIRIERVPFENYRMPQKFKWEYAFYKLCALEYMVNRTEYDFYIGVDTDVFFTDHLDILWKECKYDTPVLLPLSFLSLSDRENVIEDYRKLTGIEKNITLIGGEFIAGSREALRKLAEKNTWFYNKIKESNFDISKELGDEAILSMSCAQMEYASAEPYIKRYWTRTYYRADFSWKSTAMWHLPAEKNYGFLLLYRRLTKKGVLPSKEKAAKLFNLPRTQKYNFSMIMYYMYRITHNTGNSLEMKR